MRQFTGSRGTIFNYNGDFSGDVTITEVGLDSDLDVPFQDLKEFVAEYVRQSRINQLEQARTEDILGG